MLIQQRQPGRRGGLHHVGGEVDKPRVDGLHLFIHDVAHEVALLVAVGGDGRDGRFLNLLECGVLAQRFVDTHIVVAEVPAGEVHDLLLGDVAHPVELLHLLLPFHAIDEGVDERAGA